MLFPIPEAFAARAALPQCQQRFVSAEALLGVQKGL
jgi:hypothetical protein